MPLIGAFLAVVFLGERLYQYHAAGILPVGGNPAGVAQTGRRDVDFLRKSIYSWIYFR